MSIGLKSNIDGSGELLRNGEKVLTLGTDNSVQGALKDTDGFRLSGLPGYNYIINGNFDIWQRATSQTASGYGSDDRWGNHNIGSTKTHSRQSFAVGETFPDGTPTPKYYSRTVVSSVAGASNETYKIHRFEGVSTLAGKKAILSFYAKADSNKNLSAVFFQYFGTGGSPSAIVSGIGVNKVSLTSTWQRFVITVDIPSISGKVLGTDNNDRLSLQFFFDAGSNLAPYTDNLGQQSGTFDIACVSLVEGDKDIKPIPRSYGEELTLCQRYYEKVDSISVVVSSTDTTGWNVSIPFKVVKRTVPVVSSTDTVYSETVWGFRNKYVVSVTAHQNQLRTISYTADAEL